MLILYHRISRILFRHFDLLLQSEYPSAKNLALIAVVGHGMMRKKGISARIFTALANAKVNIRMLNQGSSELNIIIGIEEADFETAIRAIYTAFYPA